MPIILYSMIGLGILYNKISTLWKKMVAISISEEQWNLCDCKNKIKFSETNALKYTCKGKYSL